MLWAYGRIVLKYQTQEVLIRTRNGILVTFMVKLQHECHVSRNLEFYYKKSIVLNLFVLETRCVT